MPHPLCIMPVNDLCVCVCGKKYSTPFNQTSILMALLQTAWAHTSECLFVCVLEHVKTRRRTEGPCAASEPNEGHSSAAARLAQRRERATASERIGARERRGSFSPVQRVYVLPPQSDSEPTHASWHHIQWIDIELCLSPIRSTVLPA